MAQQERAVRTRAAIVRAAAEVFGDIGYEVATIADILKLAGVTKGALYFHFASKRELAQAVLDEQVHAVPELPHEPIHLQLLFDQGMLLAHLLKSDPLVRGSVRLTIERGGHEGPDRRGPYLRWAEVTGAQLERARASGELLPHADVEQVAQLIVGAFAGVQGMSQALTNYDDVAERAAVLYQSVLPAVAVPSVLGRLDLRPDRGERVMERVLKEGGASDELRSAS
ncbi:TetR/AcrR family transcriptional regulator [Streptomyces sp. XM4193]|uniref:ScbR family autoregulator-binding transcription factor n=1 Tax=Streptomyces sp. XM4193 TaxID=2929782 RepID=UPI001FF828B9|nr:ScbR family autoregulator-binding transcription factor [Streptomyces sp. XM4193]MCK1794598.1 TetR/AcrR family transcriptional regulator [Streptomyces sp. XM4193]